MDEITERLSEQTIRPSVAALDSMIGTPMKVLDDGFVRVIDYMGDDSAIVQAARVSYGVGTKRLSEDRALLRYLMRHHHTTPFEMCELKLHVRVPMDSWRQWIRHRTANVNEYSTRYSIAIDSAQATMPSAWRAQSTENKQGSSAASISDGERLTKREQELHEFSRAVYRERLDAGVAREQARKDLPLSTYTEAYWKIDLHNLFNFLRLRMDDHAQYEIRQFASIIGHDIVAKWCPNAWEAFLEFGLGSMSLSRIEQDALRLLNAGQIEAALDKLRAAGLIREGKTSPITRELSEFGHKLARLGLARPWREEQHD